MTAIAVPRAAGASSAISLILSRPSSEDTVILARTDTGVAPFADDPRWRSEGAGGVAPWTYDHTELFGAVVRRLRGPR